MPLASLASPALAAVLLVAALLAALVLGGLSLAYRRALVRGLRERHPALWAELAGASGRGAPFTPGGRRLARFLRAGRHYAVNDADLAAAARLYLVTGRVAAAVALLGVGLGVLLARG